MAKTIAEAIFNRGREEGRKEAREEGRKEGRKEGREEGRQEGYAEVIAKMAANKMTAEEIAAILQIDINHVRQTIAKGGRK